ncbi:NF-kappa-B inhibitor-like protein 1 [Seriola lalandi dorsalis]|uniref:NF-kappa-B inhibitor-like protein 1 n=1 Tax=Seriola lalandi dorsalis TaxID=1841481 RepID=A0A3B4YCF2_SERLL|nr:NF-kappa-B inhibitor-like protein 1 [Seriola lalandi dorsalis]XP_056259663.1 NF-kappa-B inhibitor-like protein 1 [Seriola aureovittata]
MQSSKAFQSYYNQTINIIIKNKPPAQSVLSMVSNKQKRVWRYVEDGSLLKLKSYLRKHRDLDVNFSQGKRQRSPLHLACCLGDDAVLRLLLKHGADVLQRDHKGDTALHTAVNRALKHGKTAYDDLVVPLKKSCPEAMNAPNSAGVTPEDLLKWMKHTESAENMSRPPKTDPEKEWLEKLFGECEDEFCETFGVYDADDFLPVDDDDEDFGDWADRIRKEYFDKKHAEAQRLAASSSGWKRKKSKQEREQEEQSRKELHEKLQREHEEYLARAARKEEETRQGKKRRYDEKCEATFRGGSSAGSTKLSYSDIPWPAPRGTVQEMVDVMLHGVDRKDVPVFRKMLRKQQALWHPDKFAQRCEARLEEKDKQRILDTVTALSQELNRLAQSLRT